jgi:hypothetical protein
MRIVPVICLALAVLCLPSAAYAGSISLSTQIGQGQTDNIGMVAYYRSGYVCSGSSAGVTLTTTAAAPCQSSTYGTIDATAMARGVFDAVTGLSLGVAASVSSNNLPLGSWGAEADATASFTDQIVVNGGTPGTAGFVHMTFQVDGTRSASGTSWGGAEMDWYANNSFLGWTPFANGSSVVGFDIPVLFGTAKSIRLATIVFI